MSAPVRGATGQQGIKAPPTSQEENEEKCIFIETPLCKRRFNV
jgi:hypothetical protein